jgi:hypothetical protein
LFLLVVESMRPSHILTPTPQVQVFFMTTSTFLPWPIGL